MVSAVNCLPFGKVMVAVWGLAPDVRFREKRTLIRWSGAALKFVSNWNSNTNSSSNTEKLTASLGTVNPAAVSITATRLLSFGSRNT